jgi:hypothetical protein
MGYNRQTQVRLTHNTERKLDVNWMIQATPWQESGFLASFLKLLIDDACSLSV